jgi:hypothetical protein
MSLSEVPAEFPVRQVWGLEELLWAIRHRLWRKSSQSWQAAFGTVEACSFLRFATNAGWFSVSYSYAFGNELFSGELRKWIIARKTSRAESDPDTIEVSKLFPLGLQIRVRVDPKRPARSVVD